MKTRGPHPQNIILSYEENEPIGPKLVYLNKNPPSIERQKPTLPEMYFEISCTDFPDNLYLCSMFYVIFNNFGSYLKYM